MKRYETPLLKKKNNPIQDVFNDKHKKHLDFFLYQYISVNGVKDTHSDEEIEDITQLCIGPDWEEKTINEAKTYVRNKLNIENNHTLTQGVFNINDYISSALKSQQEIEHNEWELLEFTKEAFKTFGWTALQFFSITSEFLSETKDSPFSCLALLPLSLGIGFAGLTALTPIPALAYSLYNNVSYGAYEITKSMNKIISTDTFYKPGRALKHLIRTGITIGLTMGGIKGGMLAGAAIGTAVAPGIGTGIGTAVGAAFGGIYSLGYGTYISKTFTRELCSSLRSIPKSILTQQEKQSLQEKGFNTDEIEKCIQILRTKKKSISYKTCIFPHWSGSVAKRKINDLIKKLKNGVMSKEITIGSTSFNFNTSENNTASQNHQNLIKT